MKYGIKKYKVIDSEGHCLRHFMYYEAAVEFIKAFGNNGWEVRCC